MKVFVGTSGFAYKEWRGSFYPETMREKDMLSFYSRKLAAVEINNTFYRMPSVETLARWAEQVPADFTFVLKASQRITHRQRLSPESVETVRYLFETANVLGSHLGPVFFQTPPLLARNLPRLREFLKALPPGPPVAFEFRHESWFDEEVYAVLRERNAALVVADTEAQAEADLPLVATADWGYLRLRRRDYDETSLDRWRERLLSQPWREAYVFFKHEDDAPLAWPLVERFARAVGAEPSRAAEPTSPGGGAGR